MKKFFTWLSLLISIIGYIFFFNVLIFLITRKDEAAGTPVAVVDPFIRLGLFIDSAFLFLFSGLFLVLFIYNYKMIKLTQKK